MKRAVVAPERATQRLQIGEFAKQAMLSRDTVRFYEKAGLLKPTVLPNGYRVFDESQLELARSIRIGQFLGFTLAEIKAQMGRWNALSPTMRIRLMEEKIEVLDARMQELKEMRAHLAEKVSWMQAKKRGVPKGLEEAALRRRKRSKLDER